MKKDSRESQSDASLCGIADAARDSYEAPVIEELGNLSEFTRTDLSFEVI